VVIRRLELLPGTGVYSIDLWWHAPISRPEAIMGLLLRAVIVSGVVVAASRLVYRLRRVTIPEPLAIALAGVGWVASWLPGGFWPYAVDIMKQAAVPLTVFTLLSFGEIVLITRASMIDTLHEDYILTAFAKGLPESTIRDRHAARNALGPVLSRLLVSLPYLLTGVVMIEYALKWEGVGTALFYAFGRQNVSLAMGALIVVAVISLVTRIVLDTLVAALDPRIRFGVQRTGVSP
jgi:peptide/nickel transport system permease protein